jgi:hypothetical protein
MSSNTTADVDGQDGPWAGSEPATHNLHTAASQDFFGVTIMHNDTMNYSESVGFDNRLLQLPHQARHDQEQ